MFFSSEVFSSPLDFHRFLKHQVIDVSVYAQIGQSHAIDSGSDDAGIKEDFLQRKHLDFYVFLSSRDENWWGLNDPVCFLMRIDCHFAKLKRGLSKRPLIIFLSINYNFNAKIQQPRREGGQLYHGWPGSVAAHDYGEYPIFAIHC